VLFRPRHDHRHGAPTCARRRPGMSGDRAALQLAHAQFTSTRRARGLHGCPARQSCAQPSDQQNRREWEEAEIQSRRAAKCRAPVLPCFGTRPGCAGSLLRACEKLPRRS
jgi:hypothetical protein